jgi:hypothetical protein
MVRKRVMSGEVCFIHNLSYSFGLQSPSNHLRHVQNHMIHISGNGFERWCNSKSPLQPAPIFEWCVVVWDLR